MASHSSILAWKIPWTEKPGGIQSTGLQESDRTRLNENQKVQCGEWTALTRAVIYLETQGWQFSAQTAPFQALFPGGRGETFSFAFDP